MWRRVVMAVGVVAVWSGMAFAQASDTPFQVRVVTNLKKKDTIAFTNSGASSTVGIPQNGKLCMNVYALSTTGPMLDCCTCPVAANSLAVLGITTDVLANRKPLPKALVLKTMATNGGGNAVSCNAATPGTGGDVFSTGMLAWKGESPFSPATLSAAELTSLVTQCGILHATPVVCPACLPPPT